MPVRSRVRATGALATATAAALAMAAPAASAATARAPQTFTWSGADSAAGVNNHWSDPGNWQGDVAPTTAQPVNLVFPPLHCAATGPCGNGSVNDLTGLQVGRLTIQTAVGPNYVLSGNTISLSAGLAMTAQPSKRLPDYPSLSVPIQLAGSQTWSMDRSGLFDLSPVTGPSAILTLKVAHGSDLIIQGGGADLGGMNLIGADPADTGLRARRNGQVVAMGGTPFTVTGAVTVTDAAVFLHGTTGPLSLPGSQLWMGTTVPPGEGSVSATGNIAFGSQSILHINGLFPGKAGQFYPQIRATGSVALDGAVTTISAGCAQRKGTLYTLITAKGGVSGTLSRIDDGVVKPISQGAVIETQENDAEGSCEGPPPQWVQINYNDAAGTVTATAVPRP
jgi:hypothetical protein